MSDLQTTITKLADAFAREILAALRGASLDEISGAATGTAGVARRGPGRPRKEASTASAPPTAVGPRLRRVRKGGRRSAGDLQGTVDAVVAVLKKNGDGMRSEQIQKALRLTKKDVTRPITLALETKAIKKKGQKRGTTYFAA